MEKIIIAAVSENGVIGKNGDIPWHLPEDLKHFKEKTMGNPVLMGRKTFQSLPEDYRPLPGRKNIVLTKSDFEPENKDVETAEDLEKGFEIASQHGEHVFVIGGASVYREALETADKMVLTEVKREVDGDTFFPDWKQDEWREVERDEHEELDFVEYRRKRN